MERNGRKTPDIYINEKLIFVGRGVFKQFDTKQKRWNQSHSSVIKFLMMLRLCKDLSNIGK